jgi:hypothetical protein
VWQWSYWDYSDIPYFSESHTDKYTGDTVYHGTNYLKLDVGPGSIVFIREDTTMNKVFIVPFDIGNDPMNHDTVEHILYDYNLVVGDTFYFNNTIPHYVSNIDSVLINGVQYKIWELAPANGSLPYYVLEGIGSLSFTCFPADPVIFEANTTLTCFTTHNSTPPLDHKVDYYFDNATSCTLAVNDITKKNKNAVVSPNPITTDSKITLPYSISSGTLVVLNDIGQTIINTPFQNKDELLIGDNIATPGIFFFSVTDKGTGNVFAGKFVYR